MEQVKVGKMRAFNQPYAPRGRLDAFVFTTTYGQHRYAQFARRSFRFNRKLPQLLSARPPTNSSGF